LSNITAMAIVVAGLYFARDVLVPIAVALLLSFVLSPLVRVLQQALLPRALAVLSAVLVALIVIVGLGTMVMVEVSRLTSDLPRYQQTLTSKARAVRDTFASAGILRNGSELLRELDRHLKESSSEQAPSSQTTLETSSRKPVPVEVHQPDPAASEALIATIKPLVSPFMTSGIILVFLVFFLFQRQDIRDRFIRLVGSDDLERTTAALDDAGTRLSRLFLTQFFLNAAFGIVIGTGLAFIGVPSAALWGLLAMILRFVPYVGALLAAALPIALAAAVDGGWMMTGLTVALFVVTESLTAQVAEPLICGRSAGLSPVAVVVAASFWTWLWGPLGLLLSTPLTLCLVVFARHVPRLRFIDVLLGDRPALSPQEAAYHRLLKGDPMEAIEQARAFVKEHDIVAYYDDILLGALRLAAADAARGRLDDPRLENIHKTVCDVVEDLAEQGSRPKDPDHGSETSRDSALRSGAEDLRPIYAIPGLGRLDDCAVVLVADLLRRHGKPILKAGADKAIARDRTATAVVCFLEEISEGRIQYTKRKMLRTAPSARVIVCSFGGVERPANSEIGSLGELLAAIEVPSRTAPSAARIDLPARRMPGP
jgi:predicted PurR-regulated permease PerM